MLVRRLILPTCLLAALPLAGCSLVSKPYAAPTPPGGIYSPSAAARPVADAGASPTRAARRGWVRIHDASGMSFALPTAHDPIANGSGPYTDRTYLDESAGLSYRVDVFELGQSPNTELMNQVLDAVVRSLYTASGFTNYQVASSGSGAVRDHVVSAVGVGIQADLLRYTLVRTQVSGRTVTMMFTAGVGKDGPGLRDRVAHGQHRLLASVRRG